VPIPRVKARWYDLVMRAVMVAILVGVTVTLSFRIGSSGSGILAVFPIILISVMLILHRRVGGKPTAAVMANAVTGLVGFALACMMLHFTAEPLGAAIGLTLALATSVAWGLLVYAARRRGIAV
jgi:FtsH-binding integral membrane protein